MKNYGLIPQIDWMLRRLSEEDNQKELRDNLEKKNNSKFFKFLNDYFSLEDEEITNIINQ